MCREEEDSKERMDVDMRRKSKEVEQRAWKKKRGVRDCRGMKGERGAECWCHKVYLEFIALAEIQTPSSYSFCRLQACQRACTVCEYYKFHVCKVNENRRKQLYKV